MRKGNEKWEKLIHITDEYVENPNLAAKAIEQIQAKQKIKKRNWFLRSWKYVAACSAAMVVGLCVGIPIYNAMNTPNVPEIIYYETSEIAYEKVSNPNEFVMENELDIHYFNFPTTKTQGAFIKSTGEFAFLNQDMLYIDDMGFDEVNLKVVLKKNAEFDFYKRFSTIEQSKTINEVEVQYGTSISDGESEVSFLAKFTYEQAEYYLEISTEGDVLERLELYVNMLIM